MNPTVYLDNAATTAPDPVVLEVMARTARDYPGNASSLHSQGARARGLLEECRDTLCSLIGAKQGEVVFTGSGTESNNLALKGVALANNRRGNQILVSALEHDCILETAKWLEELGFRVTRIPVDSQGILDPESVIQAVTPATFLVSVMHVNNEIGTVQPVAAIGRICRERNILFHSDACQSFGKIAVDVEEMNVDLLTVNAHKLHGPKGAGALYVRSGVSLTPLLHGGGQEAGMRSSTENLAGIAGFIRAAGLAVEGLGEESKRLRGLQQHLIMELSDKIAGIYFNGSLAHRVPHNLNFCIEGLEGEGIRLQLLLDDEGICVSTGSACSSNHGNNPSHVLQAIGLNPLQARGGIRVSFGRFTTHAEISRFIDVLEEKVALLNPIF